MIPALNEAGKIGRSELKGSWAGAFGQTQFIPSTWASAARDGDGSSALGSIDRLSGIEAEEMELVIDGVLAIQAGSNPRLVAQKLRSLLPPDAARAAEAASTRKAA